MLPFMAQMLNEGLGTVLCGSWINVCLLTFETFSVIHYFSRFPTDLLWIRALVVSMYTVSIAATVNNSVMLYMVRSLPPPTSSSSSSPNAKTSTASSTMGTFQRY